MTPRDTEDPRSDDQEVDRRDPAADDTTDEAAEPTVTRLSREDVQRYAEDVEAQQQTGHDDRADPEQGPAGQPTPPRAPDDAAPTVPLGGSPAGPDDQPTRPLDRPRPGSDDTPTVVSGGPLVGDRRGTAEPAQPAEPSTRVMGAPTEGRTARDPLVARPPGVGPSGGVAAAAGAATGAATGAAAGAGADDEEARRAQIRAEREARDRALGKRRPQPAPVATVEPPSTRLPRTTDRFAPSLGLFLLRLAVAAVLGVRGAQQLMDIPGTVEVFAGTALPYPEILAWATAVASVLVAAALVLGFAVRIAGVGAALVGIGALVYVYWWQMPFQEGTPGFLGETELLLAVLGVFLLLVGGGAWGIDGAIRKGRLQRKADKFEAERV